MPPNEPVEPVAPVVPAEPVAPLAPRPFVLLPDPVVLGGMLEPLKPVDPVEPVLFDAVDPGPHGRVALDVPAEPVVLWFIEPLAPPVVELAPGEVPAPEPAVCAIATEPTLNRATAAEVRRTFFMQILSEDYWPASRALCAGSCRPTPPTARLRGRSERAQRAH